MTVRIPRLLPQLLLALLPMLNIHADTPASTGEFHKPTVPQAPQGAPLRVNSLGFLPQARKLATIAAPCSEFSVIDETTGQVVFKGQAGTAVDTAPSDTGERVQILDFSALKTPGRYHLLIPGLGTSASFAIGNGVWNNAFQLVARGFYLWRCGVAVDYSWEGKHYHQEACHLGDGLLDFVGGPKGQRRPSTGGWHDAGDYNKYVVNAGVSVGLLFRAWEQFRKHIEPLSLQIPESGTGMPDLLAELRFEFDWLFTMQNEDGSVYHKLSAINFAYWGRPDKDTSPRYFTPGGTTAAADFAAMMALGARHFREFDAGYADRCLTAARKTWNWLAAHPKQIDANLEGFHTGGYQAKDESSRLWAAFELWESTGEESFLRYFENLAASQNFSGQGPTWGDLRDLALGGYLLSSRPEKRDTKLVSRLEQQLIQQADKIAATAETNPHGRPYGGAEGSFYWGCNGTVVAQTYLLHVAHRLRPNPAYPEAVQHALSHLFGRNYHGRSYITGLGHQPPEHLHDRRGSPTLPGYLVGGPWPTAKHWHDEVKDAARNEIAINWNASLLYAIAGFTNPDAKP